MTDLPLLRPHDHHPPGLDIPGPPGRYLGWFENRYGEQLVFVHDAGQPTADLYAGDVDWQQHHVSDANGQPTISDLLLNDEERAFVRACWLATAPARPTAAHPGR